MKIKNGYTLEASWSKLEKFWLYETKTYFYLIGLNETETKFRLLKINRTIERPDKIAEIIHEDQMFYSAGEMADILDMIAEGNRQSGGLIKICTAYAIVGFVKFLNGFYLTLVTQRKEVGNIAGNTIYSIKATEMFPIKPREEPESNAFKTLWKKLNKKLSQTNLEIAENRYLGLFQFVDMTKDFFFSYTYDLTHSLQFNYLTSRNETVPLPLEMFEWNHYQINDFRMALGGESAMYWTLPIIHGSYQQRRFSIFGRIIDMILMARRSRHYAGTRYLKRGLSVHGKVANDCEVEQIIQYDGGNDWKFTSYVQMRGSIPTYWYQETSVTMPKPPILLNRVDPDYLASQEHFSDMFRRYSSPVIVLDLVKQHEKRPRESIIGREFRQAIEVLNESIGIDEHKIRYIALDYSRITSISKGKFTKVKAKRGGPVVNSLMSFKNKGNKSDNRAMAAVGDEWAMMEKSLARTNTLTGEARSTLEGDPNKAKKPASTLTNFDDAKKDFTPNTNISSGADGIAIENIAEFNAVESRIDVLKELEDIANLTLHETGFFCSDIQYCDRVQPIIAKSHIMHETKQHLSDHRLSIGDRPNAGAETVNAHHHQREKGYMIQHGVLRTNCVDCLDRTNGGQFAVAMRFLILSLQALGLTNNLQNPHDVSKDPILLSLMEMYGEMGDKIALQYGGSEAHKKVLAGKSVKAATKSKQSELLTSIKRYYSNAFTDMVKQDAMNLFLGCFVPSESGSPLWDLESDYHLHNSMLHPPFPKVYKVLYNEIVKDCSLLREVKLKTRLEVSMKRALLEATGANLSGNKERTNSMIMTSAAAANALAAANAANESTGVSENANNKDQKDENKEVKESTNKESADGNKNNANAYIKIDWNKMIRHYYIRHLVNTLDASSTSVTVMTDGKEVPVNADVNSAPPANIANNAASTASSLVIPFVSNNHGSNSNIAGNVVANNNPNNMSLTAVAGKLKAKNALSSTIRTIARFERRKLLRVVAANKISNAAEMWWVEALTDYEGMIRGTMNCVYLPTTRNNFQSSTSGTIDADSMLPVPDQYTRVHQPDRLTEFDTILALDYFQPIPTVPEEAGGANGGEDDEDRPRKSADDDEDEDALIDGGGRADSNDLNSAPLNSLTSLLFFYPTLLGGGGGQTAANTAANAGATQDETSAPVAPVSTQDSSALVVANAPPTPSRGVTFADPTPIEYDEDMTQQSGRVRVDSSSGANTTSGFQFSKYVREIGMKAARTLVGNFLKKEENNSSMNPSDRNKRNRSYFADQGEKYDRVKAQISSMNHYIPRHSNSLYKRYVNIAHDPWSLYDMFNSNNSKSKNAALFEEYQQLLRENNVSVDDVKGMEALSEDGYISSVFVKRGVYQGLPPYSSAQLAHLFLFTCMVNLEPDLQMLGATVDQKAHFSRQAAFTSVLDSTGVADANGVVSTGSVNTTTMAANASASGATRPASPSALPSVPSTPGGSGHYSNNNNGSPSTVPITNASQATNSIVAIPGTGRPSLGPVPQTQPVTEIHHLVSLRSTSLEMTALLQDRIADYITRFKMPHGLEAELKKNVNNYIFQQYTYSKEISLERLARRISPSTSEKTILDYAASFDNDVVASNFNDITYIASANPNYSSFRDIFALQTWIENKIKTALDRKKLLLQELREKRKLKEEQEAAAAAAIAAQRVSEAGDNDYLNTVDIEVDLLLEGNNSSASELTSRRGSMENIGNRLFRPESVFLPSVSGINSVRLTNPIPTAAGSSNKDVDGTANSSAATSYKKDRSISSQLGLDIIDGLSDDLHNMTDYTLSLYGTGSYPSFPYNQIPGVVGESTSISTPTTTACKNNNSNKDLVAMADYVNASLMPPLPQIRSSVGDISDLKSMLPAGNGVGLILTSNSRASIMNVEHEYQGFNHIAPDLFSRSTNPHLQMNEIGVVRFQESLKITGRRH